MDVDTATAFGSWDGHMLADAVAFTDDQLGRSPLNYIPGISPMQQNGKIVCPHRSVSPVTTTWDLR
jgi:hypothetical protein